MIIRSNKIRESDVIAAFNFARETHGQDIWGGELSFFEPRDFTYGYKFYGHSVNGVRHAAHDPSQRAATWAAWGYVIAYLYSIDPDAQVKAYISYKNADDFRAKLARIPEAEAFLSLI